MDAHYALLRLHAAVAGELRNFRFSCANEDELQVGVAGVLNAQPGAAAGHVIVTREAYLARGERVDVLVESPDGRVGVECKVAGSAVEVLMQLQRYADTRQVDALVLVTTRMGHRALPSFVRGLPLAVVYVGGAAC